MEIYDTNTSFDFKNIHLTKPTISNGSYFIKFLIQGNPLYIQPPKCKTKQGIIKAGKRLYCDLLFTNDNEDFIQWMENLENYCQQTIYENREKWFDGDMELHDIENYFTSTLKIFKSGKFYIVRTNLSTVLGKPILKIYDEDENEVEYDKITDVMSVMSILEIQGIKCSSKSFQIEIEMKQLMVLRQTNIFEKCIIKSTSGNLLNDASEISIKKTTEESLTNRMIQKEVITDTSSFTAGEIKDKEIVSENNTQESNFIEPLEIEPQNEENKDKVNLIQHDNCSKEVNNINNIEQPIMEDNLEEIDFPLEELKDDEPMLIKKRNNIYYEMYKEAKRKAKIARDLALSAYLEAKRIKNTYMLDDIDDEDSDNDSDNDSNNDSDSEEEQ